MVPTPTTFTGMRFWRAVWSAIATSPDQAWPSVMTTNPFGFFTFPNSS